MSLPQNTAVFIEPDDLTRRERARRRIYVLCQFFGWGGFLALNIVILALVGPNSGDPRPPLVIFSQIIFVAATGLLITHLTRPLLERWGWKQLGWRALSLRILATAAVQSILWAALGYTYNYVLHAFLHLPLQTKFSWTLLFSMTWIQGFFLLCCWHCIYFFYHLFDRYNRLQIEQLRLAAHVKEAELRALKSQVNPHFIFNALNSLRALIDEEPARARQAVTQLANLLRYSLQSAQAETVPFEDELRVVNDYLALEQVRHEERLRVRYDVAPDTLALAVPPLLLQTLVENAVKYGISTRPEGGEIQITARCRDGQLELRVINPGELPAAGSRAPAGSTGLGLRNAAERLRMFFGERARLHLRAENESQVVAEVFIPISGSRA